MKEFPFSLHTVAQIILVETKMILIIAINSNKFCDLFFVTDRTCLQQQIHPISSKFWHTWSTHEYVHVYVIVTGMLNSIFLTQLHHQTNLIFISLLTPKAGKEMLYYIFNTTYFCPKVEPKLR